MHFVLFVKQVSGTNGDAITPIARVGETVTAIGLFQNLNEFLPGQLVPGTYTIDSIVDVVHHADGDEFSTNLLPSSVTLYPADFDPARSFVLVTNTYLVRSGDAFLPSSVLKDDFRAYGTDNHDDVPGDIPQPFIPFQSAPAQITILSEPKTNHLCVIEAVSDSYNPGGSDHAVWMPGISTNLIFTPAPGSWTENSDGTASLMGTVRSRTNFDCGFTLSVSLSGKTLTPPPGSPKKDHNADVYIDRGGPVNPATWYYYTNFTGTLTGFGNCWTGAVLMITRTGPAWQVGVGANGKNVRLGISAWFNWMVINQRLSGPPLPDGKDPKHGDFNLDIVDCVPCPTCVSPYPFASAEPRTSVPFNEAEILRAFSAEPVSPTGTIKVWYNDEHALALGVRSVIVKTSAGSTTNSLPVTPMGSNPGAATSPLNVGFTALTGDLAGTDAAGRPLFPSLFITDVTTSPASLAGDWQYGGTPIPPHAVFGTWKAIVKRVDKTKTPQEVTYIVDANPAKNNWNLGPSADPAPPGLVNEDFGAEVRWNISELGLLAGRKYRLQFMLHDGDQSKTGGDTGQGCVTICMPDAAPQIIAPRLVSYESRSTSDVRLTIFGPIGKTYQIEASSDLQDWRFVTILENNSGFLDFSDLDRGPRCCFYRVKMLP